MKFTTVKEKHEKVVIIGGGESLRGCSLMDLVDFTGAVITVNNVIFSLPRVDYWITVDPIDKNGQIQEAMRKRFAKVKYYCAFPDLDKPENRFDKPFYKTTRVNYLERIVPKTEAGETYALQEDKDKITTGDSMYGALGLAYHFEPKAILILGLDVYGVGHWYDLSAGYNDGRQTDEQFEKYKNNLVDIYNSSVPQLRARGIEIKNGSLYSKIEAFEKVSVEEGIKWIKEF